MFINESVFNYNLRQSQVATTTGVDKFLYKRPIFQMRKFYLRAWSGTQKMGAQSQIVRPIETQLETLLFALYYLNSTYNLHFQCQKFLQWGFCSLSVVLTSKIRCFSLQYKCTRLKVLKINSATDNLIIICKKFSEKIFLGMTPERYFW